jgi:hypothetical protein
MESEPAGRKRGLAVPATTAPVRSRSTRLMSENDPLPSLAFPLRHRPLWALNETLARVWAGPGQSVRANFRLRCQVECTARQSDVCG